MIYLSGAVREELLALDHPRIGAMFQPRSYGMATVDRWPMFAADCGGYGGKFNPNVWLPWIDKIADRGDRCLFAVVPDRFDPDDLDGNLAATAQMWEQWYEEVLVRGLRPAWVAQNGATPDDIPPEAGAVFIGGSTDWKLSEQAWTVVTAARAHELWVHMGRVNGGGRFGAGYISGVDSADGNVLKYGYDRNIRRLLTWLDDTESMPLPLFP